MSVRDKEGEGEGLQGNQCEERDGYLQWIGMQRDTSV